MAWDFEIDHQTGDMTGGYVTGQDEIVQRIVTRLLRHWAEWFVNTRCGLPWYAGPSNVNAGQLTSKTAILGSRNFRYADNWIRNEVAETNGVRAVIAFNTAFDASTRNYSLAAQIITDYGLPYLLRLDSDRMFKGQIPKGTT